jgi:hypothetical protein
MVDILRDLRVHRILEGKNGIVRPGWRRVTVPQPQMSTAAVRSAKHVVIAWPGRTPQLNFGWIGPTALYALTLAMEDAIPLQLFKS